jgi:hypothetical protein
VQNRRKAERAAKRGGETEIRSLDFPGAERELVEHLVTEIRDVDRFFRDETIRAVVLDWGVAKVLGEPHDPPLPVDGGAFFAWLVAWMQGQHYLEIILPGSILGLIVGYATQSFGAARQESPLRSRTAQ